MIITSTIPTTYTLIIPTIVTTKGQGEYYWQSGLLAQKATYHIAKTPPVFRKWQSGLLAVWTLFWQCGFLLHKRIYQLWKNYLTSPAGYVKM